MGTARRTWRMAVALGRVFLALIFVVSALNKLMNWEQPAAAIADTGLTPASLFLAAAIALELVGGILLLTGLYTRIGVLLLMAFLIPTTLIMHDFWTLEGAERQLQAAQFLENVSILGGLLVVLGVGAGGLSVDSKLARDRTRSAPDR
ncbi:MAG TPA: DoxX family protein [Kofleriaceae bacterium]|nr:DoxX family protein [Kofleriaceae bacterium]